MEIFLVGGAVRDELLGKPIKERDWVVVGSAPDEMLKKGFQPVGKDFPVFLHPKTHEEYALARCERKTGKGYKGFHFYTTPDVTLADDLVRRDLTINAIAKNQTTGELIDPYGGQHDLCQKILRHVSPAFAEDPVRILRVARFASTLVDFHVHPETTVLMQHMVQSGEVDALVAERVWKELSRALVAEKPQRFFEILQACGALTILFPQLHAHPYLSAFDRAIHLSHDSVIRFAALLHHLNSDDIQSICKRYRVPTEFSELTLLISNHHNSYTECDANNPTQLLYVLKSCDAFRRPERFNAWILACRTIHEKQDHRTLLLSALHAAKTVDIQPLLAKKLQGKAFADALQVLQLEAIAKAV